MWGSVLKTVGLAPAEAYIQPRLSIGHAVPDKPYSLGHFIVQVDAQAQALIIKNKIGRVIWKSLQNAPFISSSCGEDTMVDNRIVETDEQSTRLQTITHVEHKGNTIRLYGGLSTKLVKPTHLDYIFTLKELSSHQLQFMTKVTHRDPSMENHKRILVTFESRSEEDFYGFGAQFLHGSLKGHKVPILVRDQGKPTVRKYGKTGLYHVVQNVLTKQRGFVAQNSFFGDDGHVATYATVPQYITSDNRCLFLENSEYVSFDLTKPDRVVIRLDGDNMTGRLVDGGSMLDLITEYTTYAGRMRPLPDWISEGVVVQVQGGRDAVRRMVHQLHQRDIPLAAVLIQDWTGQRLQPMGRLAWKREWWNWENDTQLYPDWESFVKELKESSEKPTRVLSYVNPFLVDIRDKHNSRRNLFLEAQEHSYLVEDPRAQSSDHKALAVHYGPEFNAALLDLTNPEARTWFKQILKDQIWNAGIAGVVADCGEHLPYESTCIKLHSGEEAKTYHNRYPEDWASLQSEVIHELGLEKEIVSIHRSGYTKSPKHVNILSTGEQYVRWDQTNGIKSAVLGMLSGGFSGFSVMQSDIGGCFPVNGALPGASMIHRTKELLYRWMELAAFTAVYKTQDGFVPEKNAQFYDNDDSYRHLQHTAKIFTLLAPYRKLILKEAYEKGWPLIRHLVLYYPNDPVVRRMTYTQFLLGPSIMVAPVLSPSASYVKVYFPKDTSETSWRHIWSGRYYAADGSYKAVDAPIGQPAVFIREPRNDDGLFNGILDYANTYYQQRTARPGGKN
ncbi:hypothetical protein EC973_003684 [Apophysomyces ossiformis]|uniref:Alpha-glucosidase n=1 Tax=Apophysomyces ossiformis TaxID=679940 RepID=A0A8H7BL59_9FUNG|nr:hypothetical protein EC973_003684 [Apophysomyces ossiformis]